MELICCSHFCEELNSINQFDFWTFIKDIGPILIGLTSILASILIVRMTMKSAKDEAKRKQIYKKLSEFYGPFLDLRKKSHLLYERFQKDYRNENPNFSTLKYLLDGSTFTGNDKELLSEIIKIGEKCENLIHSKAGLIDDEELRTNVLPMVTTHYLILRLAFEGKLEGEKDRFNDLSFPKIVDELIEKRIISLQTELHELNK